jgi:hypothetical protein
MDSDGKVIGIIVAVNDPADNRAYVLPFARIAKRQKLKIA